VVEEHLANVHVPAPEQPGHLKVAGSPKEIVPEVPLQIVQTGGIADVDLPVVVEADDGQGPEIGERRKEAGRIDRDRHPGVSVYIRHVRRIIVDDGVCRPVGQVEIGNLKRRLLAQGPSDQKSFASLEGVGICIVQREGRGSGVCRNPDVPLLWGGSYSSSHLGFFISFHVR